MKWAREIEAIIIDYYRKQPQISIDPETYNPVMPNEFPDMNTKKEMVAKLIEIYDKLPNNDKKDNLVPADAQFLKDIPISYEYDSEHGSTYKFVYNFPDDDGFYGTPDSISLKVGEIYDRIGPAEGRFLSPMINGKPQSYLKRAIPYYIPEKDTDITKSPSYHRYVVSKDYGDPIKQVKIGITASCFWKNPDDGGGVQIALPDSIERNHEVFDEIFLY